MTHEAWFSRRIDLDDEDNIVHVPNDETDGEVEAQRM